jgi:hypothetical protein
VIVVDAWLDGRKALWRGGRVQVSFGAVVDEATRYWLSCRYEMYWCVKKAKMYRDTTGSMLHTLKQRAWSTALMEFGWDALHGIA